jgi:hypothetical protein
MAKMLMKLCFNLWALSSHYPYWSKSAWCYGNRSKHVTCFRYGLHHALYRLSLWNLKPYITRDPSSYIILIYFMICSLLSWWLVSSDLHGGWWLKNCDAQKALQIQNIFFRTIWDGQQYIQLKSWFSGMASSAKETYMMSTCIMPGSFLGYFHPAVLSIAILSITSTWSNSKG